MYKALTLLVLLAVTAVALAAPAEEVQDQQAAEQFLATYGYYPAWYTGFRTYVSSAKAPASTYKYVATGPVAYPYTYPAAYPYAYSYVY